MSDKELKNLHPNKDLHPKQMLAPPNDDSESAEKQVELLRTYAEGVFKENITNVAHTSKNIRDTFERLNRMYTLLFVVGLITMVAAILKAFFFTDGAADAVAVGAIAGLSAASFFSLTLIRPQESLERNIIYSSWLTAAINTYWTRLMYFTDTRTIDEGLQDAISDLARDLELIADKHAAATARYKPLTSTKTPDKQPAKERSAGPGKPKQTQEGE